jgi:hypothetical protein
MRFSALLGDDTRLRSKSFQPPLSATMDTWYRLGYWPFVKAARSSQKFRAARCIDEHKHGLSFICIARVCKQNDLTLLIYELIFSHCLAFPRLKHTQYIYTDIEMHLMHLITNYGPQC